MRPRLSQVILRHLWNRDGAPEPSESLLRGNSSRRERWQPLCLDTHTLGSGELVASSCQVDFRTSDE